MYQISRSIYRRLSALVVPGPGDPTGSRSRRRLLAACEQAVDRLAYDRRYFAHPDRFLFEEIRTCFSVKDQTLVYFVVRHHMQLADEFLSSLPHGLTASGEPIRCRASTRQGTACRRDPLPGNDYCPSHKHLEEGDYQPVPVQAA
jgi:hypothetical protein